MNKRKGEGAEEMGGAGFALILSVRGRRAASNSQKASPRSWQLHTSSMEAGWMKESEWGWGLGFGLHTKSLSIKQKRGWQREE